MKSHLNGDVSLVCPSIWSCETLNLLATGFRRGTLTEEQADMGLDLLNALHVRIDESHSDMVRTRLHRFARQFKLTAYDAAYLELADRLQIPLFTRDDDLLDAAKSRNLSVTLPK
ncbi:MAG: VapC toxin family PIN domain ribonuclease [Pedosphaera sp.]|nr:VapC toxin family PIN domain ribonuclease [Pedosphaera sp.]